ncbi:hypothetical protein, partial [Oribacterium sinus]|uniref:hypothetical protein n=1 Tax=Oribacterium sinus TaxID=237576 RepID=UPI0028D5515F
MRRKNMLALGLSFVLGVGASSTLAYALPLEQEESHRTSASEVGNTEETASNTATVAEEEAKKDTAEDSSAVEEMEASDKEKEEAEEESSLSTEALGGTDRAAEEILTPLSRSRRALANPPYYASEEEEKEDRRNRILSVTTAFEIPDIAARDHMKVIRDRALKVKAISLSLSDKGENPQPLSIQPNRIVEKKRNGQWDVYSLDYYTPGVYRYKYILEIEKNSPLYLMTGDKNYGETMQVSSVFINSSFAYNVDNQSRFLEFDSVLEGDSSRGRKYLFKSREFTVEAQKVISKVYLKSSFDIHNVHVGDLMKRVTLTLDKIVLPDGTEQRPGIEPYAMNAYKEFPNNLNQFQMFLISHKMEDGTLGDISDISESKAFTVGRYQIKYLFRPNYKVENYRFLTMGTDDDYGNGTEFYVNNELYTNTPVVPEYALTPSTKLTSPKFDVKEKTKYSNNSSGNSGSSGGSGGSSSGSGGSGGSSGGGSGSFKVSTSFTGQVLGVDRSLSGGQWMQDEKGWWYKRADGSYP